MNKFLIAITGTLLSLAAFANDNFDVSRFDGHYTRMDVKGAQYYVDLNYKKINLALDAEGSFVPDSCPQDLYIKGDPVIKPHFPYAEQPYTQVRLSASSTAYVEWIALPNTNLSSNTCREQHDGFFACVFARNVGPFSAWDFRAKSNSISSVVKDEKGNQKIYSLEKVKDVLVWRTHEVNRWFGRGSYYTQAEHNFICNYAKSN